jgi:hypothetical protein
MLWWGLVPRRAAADWRRTSQNANLRTSGPAGLFQVDDIENYVSLSLNSIAGSYIIDEPISLEAGLRNELDPDVQWPGTVYAADKSEQTQRAFWRRWYTLLRGYEPAAYAQPAANGHHQTDA